MGLLKRTQVIVQRFFFARSANFALALGSYQLALALACGSGAANPESVSASPSHATVRAMSAITFLNSLGVDVHVSQGYDSRNYIAPLVYTGIRNVRDSAGRLSSILGLVHQTGVKVDLLLWCNLNSEISAAERLAATGSLLAIEGPNEPNNFPIDYHKQTGGRYGTWLPIAQCQKSIFDIVKNNSVLNAYPVFGVSEGGAETTNVGLQFLTIPQGAGTLMPDGTQYADYANVHNYVSSTNANLYEDNQAWKAADPILNSWWDGLYAEYGHTWRRPGFLGYSDADLQTLPRVTTETGWDTSKDPGGQTVQGKVLVNTYLSQFKRGWSYTFIYELIDGEGSRGNQGLYTAAYVPKLAAAYIHNLTTVLADQNAIANPGYLDYSIPSEPSTVHDILLEKSNGSFELAVWGEQVSGSNNVVITFGKSHETVNVYDVTVGTDPVQTYSGVDSVPLTMSDHAMIVEIVN